MRWTELAQNIVQWKFLVSELSNFLSSAYRDLESYNASLIRTKLLFLFVQLMYFQALTYIITGVVVTQRYETTCTVW